MYYTIIVNARDYDDKKISKRYLSWGESSANALENCAKVFPKDWRNINTYVERHPFAIDGLLVAEILVLTGE